MYLEIISNTAILGESLDELGLNKFYGPAGEIIRAENT